MPVGVVPFALATAVSPLPLLALLVVLLTPRAVPNGLAFAMGWAAALLAVGTLTVAVFGADAGFDGSSAGVRAFEVVAGAALVALATWQWVRRPRGDARRVDPRWLVLADRCTPPRAFALGGVLVLGNPKNLALTVAAAGVVAGASGASHERFWSLALFAVLGTAGLAVPLLLRITLGQRSAGTLTRWRRWLVLHGTPAACVVVALIGVLFVARGLAG
jgi:hypothetical protein